MTASVGEIVLFSLIGAILFAIVVGVIVGRQIKKRKEPDFKPVLNKKETIISLASLAMGIIILAAGIFLPKLFNTSSEEGTEYNETMEGDLLDSGVQGDAGSAGAQTFNGGGTGMVTEVTGGNAFVIAG